MGQQRAYSSTREKMRKNTSKNTYTFMKNSLGLKMSSRDSFLLRKKNKDP